MNIQTIVLTAPRPRPTLARTLSSLQAAGWTLDERSFAGIGIHNDVASSGHFRAYMDALRHAVRRHGDADAYFVVEDDVVFCRSLRTFLSRSLWPGRVEKIALCSPYCPKTYRQPANGWHDSQSHRGFYLAGSQAWIFPPHAARAILEEVATLDSNHNADWEIGRWATATGREVWYHTPSLAQHEGLGNSALGDNQVTDLRYAADFIGEEARP